MKTDLIKYWLLAIPVIWILMPGTHTLRGEPVQSTHATVELISAVKTVSPGVPVSIGIRFDLEPQWHIYWLNAGDSGTPPTVEWNLPEGTRIDSIRWPVPERIDVPPLTSFGYKDTVTLLTTIIPPSDWDEESFEISARIDFLICKEICLPAEASVSLSLPVTGDSPVPHPAHSSLLTRTESQIPLDSLEWQVSAYADSVLQLRFTPPDWYPGRPDSLLFFPLTSQLIENSAKQATGFRESTFVLEIPLSGSLAALPDSVKGVVVHPTGWRGPGSETGLYISTAIQPTPADVNQTDFNLVLALVFGFVGGVILNLMPCVLPVLSIKVLGFVQQARDEHASPWRHGVFFTLGVLVSFWVLAGILIALRTSGQQLGWGFQLQSPSFLVLLASILFLFGLNLFGVFEVGTSLTGVGGQSNQTGDVLGAFVSGVTATVVATPCTAPFMGTALGFAITQPIIVSFSVFTALGLGMAFPYVILSSFPALLRFLPKPGRWMESFKQLLGFLLMATVVWLLWVLGLQKGVESVVVMLLAFVILSAAAWVLGRWGQLSTSGRIRVVASGVAVVMMIFAIGISLRTVLNQPLRAATATKHPAGIEWQSFDPDRLAELRTAGEPVFIDFTAAWCLSCQVNERVALNSNTVIKRFNELGIHALKADWTHRDESITKALATYGRNSVPLYVLYGPTPDAEPVILPEILTPKIVLEALETIQS
jgi:thiol:disulfide interchange protein DsbD